MEYTEKNLELLKSHKENIEGNLKWAKGKLARAMAQGKNEFVINQLKSDVQYFAEDLAKLEQLAKLMREFSLVDTKLF